MDAQHLANRPHDILALPAQLRESHVAEAHLLGGEEVRGVQALEPGCGDGLLGYDDVAHAIEKPRVDSGQLVDAPDGPSPAQGLGDLEDAMRAGPCNQLAKLLV